MASILPREFSKRWNIRRIAHQTLFLKPRSEKILSQNLERAIIHQKKKTVAFHFFQRR